MALVALVACGRAGCQVFDSSSASGPVMEG